jgi:hypothetical protein
MTLIVDLMSTPSINKPFLAWICHCSGLGEIAGYCSCVEKLEDPLGADPKVPPSNVEIRWLI